VAPARSLAGLRVLVTGASSGIGAAVSAALADRDARVFGTGRDSAALEAGSGHFVATLARDLAETGAPEAVVSAAAVALDGLDVVVSNAGAGWLGPFESMTAEEIDVILDINLRAPVHLAHAASPHLRDSDAGGQFVIVSSIAAQGGNPEEVVYTTAKAGLRGLADSLRWEWQEGVNGGSKCPLTLTLVSLGVIDTPFYRRRNRPYGRSWPKKSPVDDVARAIVGAIERRQPDVFVPGWLALPARLNGGLPSFYRAIRPPLDRVLGRLSSETADQGGPSPGP
jgi:NAD(P)-dependent dehydrogenase (short-subunit alcohol dehydrogenase family)